MYHLRTRWRQEEREAHNKYDVGNISKIVPMSAIIEPQYNNINQCAGKPVESDLISTGRTSRRGSGVKDRKSEVFGGEFLWVPIDSCGTIISEANVWQVSCRYLESAL